MQDYLDFARKNGVSLLDKGRCQFCGAETSGGVHECVELYNLGFEVLDYGHPQNHLFRFLAVDAHALQHSEIHGRWSNHFHLCRLMLMLTHGVVWNYGLSPQLSDHLKDFKAEHPDDRLEIPTACYRGELNAIEVGRRSSNVTACQEAIREWAESVFGAWGNSHERINSIAGGFIIKHPELGISI